MAYDNIEKLGALLTDGNTAALQKSISANEKRLSELMKKLGEMETAASLRAEEEARKAAEEAIAKREAQRAQEEAELAERLAREKAEAEKRAAEEAKKSAEAPAPQPVPAPPAAAKPAPRPPYPANAGQQNANRPASGAPQRQTFRPDNGRPAYNGNGQRPAYNANGARPPYNANRPAYNGNGQRPPYNGAARPGQNPRPPFGARPQGQTGRPIGSRPAGMPMRPAPVTPAPVQRREPAKKYDKTYVERRPVNKRALVRQQGASIGDFDEEKSGYRKARFGKKGGRKETQTIKIEHAVVTSREIPIKVLSEKLGISAVEITKRLFKEGIMKTVNESVDYDNAAFIALELGIDLEYKPIQTAEEALFEEHDADSDELLVTRAPVVTVMGHVDHGKTSLLDKIRSSNVTEGEAGGITQSIGAYTVTLGDGKNITFIDTPGHAAFTAMRARGAKITDIVVLVVAADDGVMPQTVEAINHAKAAGVQIIVAVNKMDKVGANIERVKQDLTNYGLVPEEWGGDTVLCPISCKTGEGIENLLENLLLLAEMKELLANPAREARGVVIEARLDKGKGPVATVLVQNGTLRTGDNIISGTVTGRVRAMIDDTGKTVKEAGPSMAVNVLGLEEVPNSGDSIFAVSQGLMKEVMDERKRKVSDAMVKAASKVSLEEMFGMIADGNLKTLNLIIKGDVQGSVEAVKQSVVKLSNEEVQVKVIHSGAGAITETDVMLADSSNAIILGFNVRPDTKAKTLAERSKVDVRSYRIIYDLLDDMEAALKGMLAPKYHEVYLGKCEVRQTFKITGVGNIAGCYVLDGKIVRGGKLRIYRENVLIVEGNVQQLKRFKDDVKEVSFGFECGCAIEGFNDIKIGDIIECYLIEQIAAG